MFFNFPSALTGMKYAVIFDSSINHKDLFKIGPFVKNIQFNYSEGVRFNHFIGRGIEDIGAAIILVSFTCRSGDFRMTNENSSGWVEEWYWRRSRIKCVKCSLIWTPERVESGSKWINKGMMTDARRSPIWNREQINQLALFEEIELTGWRITERKKFFEDLQNLNDLLWIRSLFQLKRK